MAMVAGETSGDLLGGRVISALRRRCGARGLTVEGVGGAAMHAQGLESIYPMERLAVMGLAEPLARLPELLRMRAQLVERFSVDPPDLFLGIDAPDFNLGLARRLRQRGLRTAQLVSPTVWAWRPGRVHTVARAVDAVLCLFPFEPPLYASANVAAHYVGHPLVSDLASSPTREEARRELGLADTEPVIALLPGSRGGEVAQLGPDMLLAGEMLLARDPCRQLLMPAANDERYSQCQALLATLGMEKHVRLLRGQSRLAMIAADVVILASGTASLEAMLLQRPMVIAYRATPVTWSIMSRLMVTEHVGLPNIFAGERVVPELLQNDLNAPALALAAEELLFDGKRQLDALEDSRAALTIDFDSAVIEALLPLADRA